MLTVAYVSLGKYMIITDIIIQNHQRMVISISSNTDSFINSFKSSSLLLMSGIIYKIAHSTSMIIISSSINVNITESSLLFTF